MTPKSEKRDIILEEVSSDPERYWTRIVIGDDDCQPIPDGNGLNYISPDVCGSLAINAGTFQLQPGFDKRDQLHSHSNEEFSYILGGRGFIAVEDEIHHFGPGDFVFVPAFARHGWGTEGDEPLRVLFWRPVKTKRADGGKPLGVRLFKVHEQGEADFESQSATWEVDGRTVEVRDVGPDPVRYWSRIVIGDEESRPIPNGNGTNYISPDVCGSLTINAGTFGHPPGYGKRMSMHSHSQEEFSYILQGEGWIAVEDETYHFQAGDFVFIPAYARHTWGNDGDERLEVLFYRPIKPQPPSVEAPLDTRRFELVERG